MKNQKKFNLRLGAVLVPVVLLSVLFSAPLLGVEIFHRVIMGDAQSYFWSYCNDGNSNRVIWCNNNSDSGQYQHFIDSSFYYPRLSQAGFNETSSMIVDGSMYNFLGQNIYDGIKVWNFNGGRVNDYGHAQESLLGVGNDLEHDYFQTPYKSSFDARTDLQYPFPGVFFCEASADSADTLICATTGDRIDTRISARVYHIQLRLRVDNVDNTTPPVPVLWMKCGSAQSGNNSDFYNAIPTSWQMDLDTTASVDDNPDTTFYLNYAQLANPDSYNTKEFITLSYKAPLHITIFWCGHMDLYLDWIMIHDLQYQQLAIDRDSTVWNSIKSDAITYFDTSHVYAYEIDEPIDNVQYRAVATYNNGY